MINFSDPVCLQVAVLSLGGVFLTAIIYRFVFGVGRIVRLLTGIVKLLAINCNVKHPAFKDEIKAITDVALTD